MLSYIMNLFGGSTSHDEIAPLIEQGAILVDVRTPNEYREKKITGSFNIPLDILPKKMNTLNKNSNIIVFCRSGKRSSMAKTLLEAHGFTKVKNGGAWSEMNEIVLNISKSK